MGQYVRVSKRAGAGLPRGLSQAALFQRVEGASLAACRLPQSRACGARAALVRGGVALARFALLRCLPGGPAL